MSASTMESMATTRIYGAAPGDYGVGTTELLAGGGWRARAELGAAYLAGSASAYGAGLDGAADAAGFAARVAGVHPIGRIVGARTIR